MAHGFKGSANQVRSMLYNDDGECRLIGPADIALMMDVSPGTVRTWKFNGQLPTPDVTITAASGRHTGDLWLIDTVMEWIKKRQS